MEALKKHCSLSEHENINAISFCPKCNIYMCNKCQNFHAELFKIHQTINLNLTKDLDDFFFREFVIMNIIQIIWIFFAKPTILYVV